MQFIFNLVSFAVLLTIIVIVHELGHLITAKYFNVYCSEFSIGMGPAIYQNKKGETTFSVRALPIGGFVQMAGEEGTDTSDIPFERTIKGIKVWKQVVVMVAGAVMNIILAWVIFVGIVMARGSITGPALPVISGIVENSAAQSVGLQAGDEITKVTLHDGSTFIPTTFDEISEQTAKFPGERIIYTISRAGSTMDYVVTPQLDEASGQYLIGVTATRTIVPIKWYESFKYGTITMFDTTRQIISALGNLVRGVGLNNMSGPVGIFQATSQITQSGFTAFVTWLGMLSVNIGIFNLIPIPILDGGRILIILLEKLSGRKINEKVETAIMMIGVALIVGLMLYVTWNDIMRLFIK